MTLTKKDLWLTSGWNFTPDDWGCVGFTDKWARDMIVNPTRIVAVYVVKHKGPEEKRGKVVGFAELSDQIGYVRDFISTDAWNKKQANRESRKKWSHVVVIKRAWLVFDKDWQDIEDIFSNTYKNNPPRYIGRCGVVAKENDFSKLKELRIEPSAVFPQKQLPKEPTEPEIKTVGDLLRVRDIKLCGLD